MDRVSDDEKVEAMREESFERAAADRLDDLERQGREAIQAEGGLEMLAAALEHARTGRQVFPVNPRTKTPMIPKEEGGRGHLDATTDEAQIREWWTRFPKAAIGYGPPRGILIIDADLYKPACCFAALEAKHGPLPLTFEVSTPGENGVRGRQLHYMVPGAPPLRTGNNALGAEVDVKGYGAGYGILPPSLHPSGGRYELEDTGVSELEIAPDWVVEALLDEEVSGVGAEQRFTRGNPCPVCEGGKDGIHGPEGTRCYGFLSSDGAYAHCTREQAAGKLKRERNGTTYAHRLKGSCDCGRRHEARTAAEESKPWPDLLQVMDETPPASARLSTGLPTLDRCLRGGLVRGRVYTFIGPPGRGKTCLLCQLGLHLAKAHRAKVAGLFIDEGPSQAALMMLEGLGFARETLEDDFASIREQVKAETKDLRIWLPDTTIAEVEAGPRLNGEGDRPTVLILDSTQRVVLRRDDEPETARERADAIMRESHNIARARSWILLLSSKANRPSYRSRKASDNTTGLASGMDSSSIEYDSDFLAYLEGNIEEGVTLKVEKNRPGDGTMPAIRLRFDRQRATFAEVDTAEWEAAENQRKEDQKDARLSSAMEKALRWLRQHKDSSTNAVREGAEIGRGIAPVALEMLEKAGKVKSSPGRRGAIIWTPTYPGDDGDQS